MFKVLGSVWALLLGMTLIMIGNGMQATLMGVRGALEGFGTLQLSVITSAYFLGFLIGSRVAPDMIRRVGHVRVFAALGSFISAGLVAFPVFTDPYSWTVIRVILGFCLSGVYVTAESWLNNAATNQTRGTMLSAYMIAQTSGIIIAQGLMNLGEAAGYLLFVIPSILVSLSFAPILLSITPTPAFETNKPMSIRELYHSSPLASVGILLMGGVFAAQFGMASVYGAAAGLNAADQRLCRGNFHGRGDVAIAHRLAVRPDGPADSDPWGCGHGRAEHRGGDIPWRGFQNAAGAGLCDGRRGLAAVFPADRLHQ